MATPRPIIDTTLAAYADTGMRWARIAVTPVPAPTPSTPTASGSVAATTDPKTTMRNTRTSGNTTHSARWRSSFTIAVKSWLRAIGPKATISSVLDVTRLRNAGKTSGGADGTTIDAKAGARPS